MRIHTVTVTPFQQNARILHDDSGAFCTVIDPGGDISLIKDGFAESQLREIILTHSHIDHAGGVAALLEKFPDADLLAHREDAPLRQTIAQQATYFGLSSEEYQNCPEPERYLEHDQRVQIVGHEARVIYLPGHAPGHIALFFDDLKYDLTGDFIPRPAKGRGPLLIGGDVLFAGSIGRTDLPFGDYAQLIRSITGELMNLPDETLVLTGHGPTTTIGHERRTNPFLLGEL